MSIIDKLARALDGLKSNDLIGRSGDKEKYCRVTADLICAPIIMNFSSFPDLLHKSIDSLFKMCDHSEANIRMVAEENLNRVVRCMIDFRKVEIFVELLKEIKKNDTVRRLRAALSRFGNICHLISPSSRSKFVLFLIPCIKKIAMRTEDQVAEILAQTFPKIMQNLGHIMSDSNIKMLLEVFVNNLVTDSSTIRRSSITCIEALNLSSRKPMVFFKHMLLINSVLMYDINKSMGSERAWAESCVIIGLLNSVKNTMLYPKHICDNSYEFKLELKLLQKIYLQIFRFCCFSILHPDSNIVMCALETLTQMFISCPRDTLQFLVKKKMLNQTKLFETEIAKMQATVNSIKIPRTLAESLQKSFHYSSSESLETSFVQHSLPKFGEEPRSISQSIDSDRPSLSSANSMTNLYSEFGDDSVSEIDSIADNVFFSEYESTPEFDMQSLTSEHSCHSASESVLQQEFEFINQICENVPLNVICVKITSLFLAPEVSKSIRTGIKSSALGCLTEMLKINPSLAFISVNLSGIAKTILHISISYTNHEDHLLRGMAIKLVGTFIEVILKNNFGEFNIQKYETGLSNVVITDLIKIIVQGLKDDSYICVCHSLSAVSVCIMPLLNSNVSNSAIPILETILSGLSSYWLVKVKLLEIIENLSFMTVYFATNSSMYQDKILDRIVFKYLYDNEHSVRHAASKCLLRVVHNCYYKIDYMQQDVITSWVCSNTNLYCTNLLQLQNYKHHNMYIEASLSRLVNRLTSNLIKNQSAVVAGSIEALTVLSNTFKSPEYSNIWRYSYTKGTNSDLSIRPCSGLFTSVLSIMTSTTAAFDLEIHCWMLKLSSNLITELVNSSPTINIKEHKIDFSKYNRWFEDDKLKKYYNELWKHVLKLLNIFRNVVLDYREPTHTPTSFQKSGENEKDKTSVKDIPARSNYFHKLQSVVRASYNNYKVSIENTSNEKFIRFLESVLDALKTLLKFISATECQQHVERILLCLTAIFNLTPNYSSKVIAELFKCLTSKYIMPIKQPIFNKKDSMFIKNNSQTLCMYTQALQMPYECLSNFIDAKIKLSQHANKRWEDERDRKTTMSGKHYGVSSESLDFSSNLKCFRPLIVKCLKEYVNTGDVELQSSILDLLIALIQSKVNLNVIDPKHEFLKYIFSQFDYLENGLYRDPKKIISTMFQFFINLSEDKNQSNIIPEAIHLCDGLMASGYSPESYCIPAILPIVEYVYILKSAFMVNSSDLKELEAQREMLFAMLLRLCQFNEVVSILSLVIVEGNEDKWKKQSRQLFDTLYTSLGGCKIQATLPSLINLLLTLHPSSYSIHQQLHVMFNTCYDIEKCTLEHWLNTVLSNLIIILIQKSEDLILLRISESDISISSNLSELTTQSDPLNASILSKNKCPGEETFSKFLFRVIYLSVNDIMLSLGYPQPDCDKKVCLLSEFLLTCQYIVQSGNFPKVVIYLRNFLNNDQIFITLHKNIMTLSMVYPLLVLHWVQFIGLLDYEDIEFWKSLLNTNTTESQLGRCFYLSIVQKGCFLILCETLNKKINLDNKLLKWFLSDCVIQLLEMGNEPSTQEFLNCIHKDPDLSLMHITAITEKCVKDKLDLTNDLLRSLNEAHPVHCGKVIKLILPVLLEDSHLALSQFASSIAIRKMEYLLALPISESSIQLSKEETFNILEYFKNFNICIKNRYCILISLFNKFGTQCYKFSSIEIDQNKSVNTMNLKNILIDKNWFYDQVKTRCCRYDCPSLESAKLLSNLPLQDVISIMRCDDFNNDILQYCFTVSTQITIETWKSLSEVETSLELCPLFVAARFVLVEHVQQACSFLPRFHQIFLPLINELNEKQNVYKTRMCQLFEDNKFIKMVLLFTSAISKFLECVKLLSKQKTKEHIILMDSNKTLLRYTVLLFELLKWNLFNKSAATSRIQLLLKCVYNVFDVCGLANELCSTELGSIASTLISVVEFITDDVLLLVTDDYYTETTDLVDTCRQISSLVSWIENSRPLLSKFYLNQITCLIIQIISRHPMVNGFVRVPPGAWKMLQAPANTIEFTIPTMPIDVLQEIDILKQFVSRLGVVGWNSKQQFEETWMTLLSVLVPSSESDIPKEELISLIQTSSAAVNGITQLFSQTLFKFYPGNTTNDKFLHISRDIPLDLSHHKWFVKLEEVNELIYSTFYSFKRTAGKETLLDHYDCRANIERIHDKHRYSYHQLSVKFLQIAISDQWKSSNNQSDSMCSILEKCLLKRIKILNESGLDLNSCILLLKEVFNQWMEPKTHGSLSQINEMIKCLLVLSDLFTERDHYIWMLNVCMDLSQSHHHEDLLLHQYVIIAAAKAMSISRVEDLSIQEKVLKLIDNGLKSNCRLTQLAALHGLLYLLEGCFIVNNVLSSSSEIIQMAVDFVQKHLCTEYSMLYECEWQLCVISIAFYLVEHGSDHIEDSLLMSLEGLTKLVSSSRHFKLYQALIQGFQRIIFVKYSNENIVEQITALAIDRLSNAPPGFSLPALQLLLSCIYAEHYNENRESDIDPDIIVVEMEKISVMFERIKKGCLLEVEVTTVIMAKVLTDIFPASYVLMRVVGEFLSPNQPHPTSMCTVVNQIFEQLIKESQLDLLQDWVITTLSNFTQGLQIPMAIYCLISFFISSSKNKWLRAIFPHVRLRLGRYDYEDKKLLCIAAMDFYGSLTNDNQKQLYKESFQSSIKSKNPFEDIIYCLE